MEILALSDKSIVQKFLESAAGNSGAEFLASLEWAEIMHSEGEKIDSLGVYDKGKLLAVFNLIIKNFNYCYTPRGPVFASQISKPEQEKIWNLILLYLKNKKIIFWRVEPRELPIITAKKSHNLQPQETLMLNLLLSEQDLTNSFHSKTRYNIRLAEKKGVLIRESKSLSDFEKFWDLMVETGGRDAFKIHNKRHYQKLATLNPDFIRLFVAELNGQVLAAGLFSFYGDKVTYLHGASSYATRQFMAPYLLQWTLIKIAKNKNYKYYDFYGIDAEKWPGVTRFKMGFSGYRVSYAGTYDVILSPLKYYLYNLLKRLKKFL